MSALSVAPFRRLALGWVFSNTGDSVLYLTLAIWMKDLTGSDAAAGLVFLFLGLPVLLAPFAGQLADRVRRRRLVVAVNLVEAAVVTSLLLVHDRGDAWIVYAVTFVYGVLTYVTSAAGSGLVRDLLDDDLLASGNGVLVTIDQGLRMISPLVGAGAYAVWGGGAIAAVTAGMLVVAAGVVATVRVEESAPAAPVHGFWREMAAGFHHIAGVPLLKRVTTSMAVAFAITGLANTAIFALIDQGLGRSSAFFGVLAAVQGAGSVVGGITAAALVGRLGERRAVALGLGLLGATLGLAVVARTGPVLVCLLLGGLSIPWIVVGYGTMRQRLTPPRLQGRVASAASMALNGPQTIGTALGAVLIAVVDYRILIVVMGVVILLATVPIARPEPRPVPGPDDLAPEPAT
jgi:MFS family permease